MEPLRAQRIEAMAIFKNQERNGRDRNKHNKSAEHCSKSRECPWKSEQQGLP
jgi:hypothetical protein